MDTDSVIAYIKTDDIYRDITEDVETRLDTSNYELDRPLAKGKNKKVIVLTKEELGKKIKANSLYFLYISVYTYIYAYILFIYYLYIYYLYIYNICIYIIKNIYVDFLYFVRVRYGKT